MPFGLRNAGNTFQQFMHEVMGDLEFVFIFMDDIFVSSPDRKTHLEHLDTIFQRLKDHGLRLGYKKCVWMQKEVDFLGYRVLEKGLRPKPDKVKDLLDLPSPPSYKSLRSVMGMFTFYRHNIPGYAQLVEPLQKLLNDTQPVGRKKNWTRSDRVCLV